MTEVEQVQAPFVQLVFHNPLSTDEEMMAALAGALVERGAEILPDPLSVDDLLVLGGTGEAPQGRAEIITRGRPAWEEVARHGAIVELLCDGEELEFFEEDDPAERVMGNRLREAFWYLIERLRPLHAVVLVEHTPAGLAELDTSVDGQLFATAGWVDVGLIGGEAEARLRPAVAGAAPVDVEGGLFWTTWEALALEGTAVELDGVDHFGLGVMEALTGRTIPRPPK